MDAIHIYNLIILAYLVALLLPQLFLHQQMQVYNNIMQSPPIDIIKMIAQFPLKFNQRKTRKK